MPEPGTSRIIEAVAAIVVFVVFVAVYAVVLILFLGEDTGATSKFSTNDESAPDRIEVDARLVSIDPVKGDLSVRLQFGPQGRLLESDGVALTKTLVLDVNSSTGKAQYVFKKGEPMNPTDVVVSLYDGNVTDYPFDVHKAEIAFSISPAPPGAEKGEPKPAKPAAAKPAEADGTPPSEGEDGEPPSTPPEATVEEEEDIPLVVDFNGALTGYRTSATETEFSQANSGFTDIEVEIARSTTVRIFSIFIMILQWLLALGALFVTLAVLIRGRKVELAMFSWLAALLFAMPPLRNAMPGAPPIGTLSDVMAFFWVEAIIALSLISIVFTWILRPVK